MGLLSHMVQNVSFHDIKTCAPVPPRFSGSELCNSDPLLEELPKCERRAPLQSTIREIPSA
ncbi:hypothetical protein EGYY_20520 [Eggerthella sp. YY7918]|nr:hypothetical protein EGYY_20520 [Eggerthella sp. YY7918]